MAPRAFGALSALVAAVVLAASLVSALAPDLVPSWWDGHPRVDGKTIERKDTHVGVLAAQGCNLGETVTCQELPRGARSEMIAIGELAMIGLTTGTLVLLMFSTWAIGERRKKLGMLVIGEALVIAGGSALLVWLGPEIRSTQQVDVPIGLGMMLVWGGAGLAAIAGVVALRVEREPLRLRATRAPTPLPPAARIEPSHPAKQFTAQVPVVATAGRETAQLIAEPQAQGAPRPNPPEVPAAPSPPSPPPMPTSLPAISRTPTPPSSTLTGPPPPSSTRPAIPRTPTPAPRSIPPTPAPRSIPATNPPALRSNPPTAPPPAPVRAKAASLPPLPARPVVPTDRNDTLRQARLPSATERNEIDASESISAEMGAVVPPPASPTAPDARDSSAATIARARVSDPTIEPPRESVTSIDVRDGRDVSDVRDTVASPVIESPPPAVARAPTLPPTAAPLATAEPEPEAEPPARASVPISTAPATLPPPRKTAQSAGPTPACPQCEAPMTWVEEHLRFYCPQCRMYF